jgi:UDP-N-acetylmuramyl tripeptide synthase
VVFILEQEWKLGNVRLHALGAHQQDNALTAVSAVLALRSQGTLFGLL